MPEEPSAAPTTHDTETLTDGVETPATEDAEVSEPATDRKFTFLSRHISALRALRFSGIFTILSAIILCMAMGIISGNFDTPKGFFSYGALPAIILSLLIWFWSSLHNTFRRLIALLITLFSVAFAGFLVHWWWSFYDQTSFNSAFLLTLGLASLGLGLLIPTDLLLRGVRDHVGITPDDPDDPAAFTSYRANTDSATTRNRILWFVLILAPTAVLTAAAIVAHTVANPVTQTTAPLPEGPLPERSTGIGTTLTWTKEVPGLLGTASGAAGPVILTAEGVTGLHPADGSTLWSYTRKNTSFCMKYCERAFLRSQLLFTSPTGRYAAVQFGIPEDLIERPKDDIKPFQDAMTVVLDTLTGQVTSEHRSSQKNELQLTDSALLDGDTAYNLNDGKIRWKLTESGNLLIKESAHSGAAGHRSFIVFSHDYKRKLISDTDPTSFIEVANLANDPLTERLVVVNGWTVQYTNLPDSENGEPRKNIGDGEARVVTLDSLAGLDDGTTPVDLGRISGVNSAASRASGTVTTYPPYDGRSKFEPSEYTDDIWVGTVFDPATQRVTPATKDAGLATAKVGLVATSEEGQLSGSLVVRPGDGSDGVTIPIAPGSTAAPPEQLARERDQQPMQFFPAEETRGHLHSLERAVDARNVPGVTLLLLDGGTRPSLRYKGHHVYQLYGLTGARS